MKDLLFPEMYIVRPNERAHFADHWCGPDVLPYGEDVLIAQYVSPEDSDGQSCDVYCCAMPARFYTLKALSGKNSIGEPKKAFTLGTGSGHGLMTRGPGSRYRRGDCGWDADAGLS